MGKKEPYLHYVADYFLPALYIEGLERWKVPIGENETDNIVAAWLRVFDKIPVLRSECLSVPSSGVGQV